MNESKPRTERYSFRVVCVPKLVAEEISKKFAHLPCRVNPYFKNEKKFVVSFPLTKDKNYDALGKYLVGCKRKMTYGLWVSLGTNRDSDGLTVPKYVCDIYQKIGGTIDFSFTVL